MTAATRSPFLVLAEAAEAIAAECRAAHAAGADLQLPTGAILLTKPDAAKALGLSEDSLDVLIADGAIPVVRYGRAVRIRRDALIEWAQAAEAEELASRRRRGSAVRRVK